MTSSPRRRVLHLANDLSDRGNGILNVAVDLAIEQAAEGWEVGFASGGGGHSSLLEEAGVQCFDAPQAMATALPNSLGLLRLLRTFKPDIVHTHMRSGFLLVWPWTRLLRVPVVMHVHNIHDRGYGTTRLPERVIAVSASVQRTLEQQGTPAGRIRVVLNGMIGSTRLPKQSTPAKLQHPAIVTVAGMMLRKGIPELIEAFSLSAAKRPEIQLYLVGGGSEQAAFEEIARRSGYADQIHFEGFRADPRPYLQSTDIFVLASRRESFGLAIIEARQAGCAIVASDVDGIPELVKDGCTGLLTPPGDPSALAARLDRLLEDGELRRQLQGRAAVGLERFTVQSMTESVLGIYQELLEV